MQIREFLHRQIGSLDVEQLLLAQNLLSVLNGEKARIATRTLLPPPYLKVRESLSVLPGSLADDIIRNRNERL